MCRYRFERHKYNLPEVGDYYSYRIGFYPEELNGPPLKVIEDVSMDFDFARRLTDLLNQCEVHLCHFMDIVEDALL